MNTTDEARLWEMERRMVVGMFDGYQPAAPVALQNIADEPARTALQALRTMQAEGLPVPGFEGLLRGLQGRGDGTLPLLEPYYPVTQAQFDHAVDEVASYRITCGVRTAAQEILRLTTQGLPLEDLEREVQARLGRALQGTRTGSPRFQQERMADLLERVCDPEKAGRPVGTGWTDLDRALGGIEAGNLVLIGARPSMGKSAFALQFAQHVARNSGPVLFQSCEMSEIEVTRREVAQVVQANSRMLLPEHISRAIAHACPLALTTSNTGVDGLQAMVATFHTQHPDMAAVFVDYLGLLQKGGADQNTESELSYISRSLKRMAERHGVPVVAVHQLNRGVEQRPDKRPLLSDLRGSGAIEQDANIVLFLFRPGYYTGAPDDARTEVRIAKARDGATQTVNLHWRPETVTFSCIDTRHEEPAYGRTDLAYGGYGEDGGLL